MGRPRKYPSDDRAERLRLASAAYYQRHRTAIRARRRAYHAENREIVREQARAACQRYQQRHRDDPAWRERERQRSRRWRMENPERIAAYQRAHRAAKKAGKP